MNQPGKESLVFQSLAKTYHLWVIYCVFVSVTKEVPNSFSIHLQLHYPHYPRGPSIKSNLSHLLTLHTICCWKKTSLFSLHFGGQFSHLISVVMKIPHSDFHKSNFGGQSYIPKTVLYKPLCFLGTTILSNSAPSVRSHKRGRCFRWKTSVLLIHQHLGQLIQQEHVIL